MQSNLTIKGQVTIPKAMRDYLGLKPGAPVHFAFTEQGGIAILPAQDKTAPTSKTASRFARLKGVNRKGWSPYGLKSTDEIMAWLRGYDDDKRDPGLALRAARRK